MEIELAARQLEALGNATRLAIHRALVAAGREGFSVGVLQARLGIPNSTLSHHLHKLIANGLVTQERQSTTLICRADEAARHALVTYLAEVGPDSADGTVPRPRSKPRA